MTQSNPPGWPPTWPRHDRPGPVLADDGSHERLYDPDAFGCGAPLATVAAACVTAVLLAVVLGIVALAASGGRW